MRPADENIPFGFFVSRLARDHYQLEKTLFAPSGKSSIPNFLAARVFAQQLNRQRDLVTFPELSVSAGQINAMALIHGISQYLFRTYCAQHGPRLLQDALNAVNQQFGAETVSKALAQFVDEFPPTSVYLHELDRTTYMQGATGRGTNVETALEELLMLWLTNSNPAFSPYLELHGDDALEVDTSYRRIVAVLYEYFGKMAALDAAQQISFTGGQNILDFLLAPARAAPHSLEGQLAYLLERWSALIGPYIYWLLRSLDLIREEHKPGFGGPGPSAVPVYDFGTPEPEHFSPDREWMPNLVLMAKNAYVWLDQLSKSYGRSITRLDQVPDEELDRLARAGFTGLWLIGLWERSTASKTIKQIMGNPEAVASAYSLYDYQIAGDLGGEAASASLKERAWRRGIRMASDMVPNHVGIDGRWMMEHPDWFVSLDYSPFPGYSFNGQDLSQDSRVGIYLEDHYYSRTDAAVVFKRVDRWTGSTRYIYHGNDGTSMPWNDTAQLNYLNPEMREAMIQTILHVARQFPVIRFDAAMTLVKKHIQRLWFPEPGTGGAIPSRAEHGLTRTQFDALMGEEFWREVVDRVANEVPDTLLLAEAFWLLEGYFVRTLGMHRVYNSAFMNMLRDEDNSKYRLVMKNTLEFDPEVLKRYVNFMNNPDERTAVDQFGKDDKYFGICTLMATMPGLPMFGHGQIEGFAEKYGMEYRRAYWDEQPDGYLLQRHEHDIFPLLRKRYLFAGVENFLLYDFFSPDGTVNEDIFAYSNAAGDERSLVIYNNRYAPARGWVRTSVGYSVKIGKGDERTLVQRSLGDGLGLRSDETQFMIFRDHKSGLEYLRNSREVCEQGLYVELGGYQCHVFLEFRTVTDDPSRQYGYLAGVLAGRGVPSIHEALQEIFVRPVREPFQAIMNGAMLQRLLDVRAAKSRKPEHAELLDEVEAKTAALLRAITEFVQGPAADTALPAKVDSMARQVRESVETLLTMKLPQPPMLAEAGTNKAASEDQAVIAGLLAWTFVHRLGEVVDGSASALQSRSWIDEWLLGKAIRAALLDLGLNDQQAGQTLTVINLATGQRALFGGDTQENPARVLDTLLQDSDAQQLLGVNRYRDVLWFSKEGYERLLFWLLILPALTAKDGNVQPSAAVMAKRSQMVEHLRQAGIASGYQVEKLRLAAGQASQEQPAPARKVRSGKKSNR